MTPSGAGRRLVVIGAGPVGIAAALEALDRGHDVTVLEQGRVGDAIRRWGPVRMFTPLAMNVTPRMRSLLGDRWPGDEAFLTGPEMADDVLEPLAATGPLSGRVRCGHRVAAVGRSGMTLREMAGHPIRFERPFRILVQGPEEESVVEAERVLDASGVTAIPCPAGSGGLPAPGEGRLGDRVIRQLGGLHDRLDSLAGATTLLIGHGHSAATAVHALVELAEKRPGTRIVWAVRTPRARPVEEVADDSLPRRRLVAGRANDLAQLPPPFLTVMRRHSIDRFESTGDRIAARFSSGESVTADVVLAMTGYRPDRSFLSELALEISPVTEGTARLAIALAGISDCLSVPCVKPEDLETGEPGFHLIGHKSYGRSQAFLIRTGLSHLAAILDGT